MLKKLIKYGNSTALVLDKAILALLGLTEDSILKLRIEGDTLLIKKAEDVKPTDQFKTEMEKLHSPAKPFPDHLKIFIDLAEKQTDDLCKKVENDPNQLNQFQQWLPGSENNKHMKEAFSKIMQKYQKDFTVFSSEEFVNDMEKLNEKYKGNTNSQEYLKEALDLRLKHAPSLAKMDEEMKQACKDLNCPKFL